MTRTDPTDVMGRRIVAYIIDTLIAIVIIVVVFSSALHGVRGSDRSGFCNTYKNENSGGVCVSSGDTAYVVTPSKMDSLVRSSWGATIGWTLLNAVLLQGLTGGTVGKLLLGLRVVRDDGRRAGIGWCALRTVVLLLVDSLCFIIGLVVALSTNGHRRLGDMAASTLVVPKEYEGHSFAVPGLTGPPATLGGGYGAPMASAPGPTAGEGPTWDPARNAYIQYDRTRSAWVQWDDATTTWNPIDQA